MVLGYYRMWASLTGKPRGASTKHLEGTRSCAHSLKEYTYLLHEFMNPFKSSLVSSTVNKGKQLEHSPNGHFINLKSNQPTVV